MHGRRIKTYTKADMSALKRELDSIPQKRTSLKDDSQATLQKLQALKQQLKDLQEVVITPAQASVDALDARINALMLPAKIKQMESDISEKKKKHEQLTSQIADETRLITPIQDDIAMLETYIKIKELQKETIDLQNQNTGIRQIISTINMSLASRHSRLDSIAAELSSVQDELATALSQKRATTTSTVVSYETSSGYATTSDQGFSSTPSTAIETSQQTVYINDPALDARISSLQHREDALSRERAKFLSEIDDFDTQVYQHNRQIKNCTDKLLQVSDNLNKYSSFDKSMAATREYTQLQVDRQKQYAALEPYLSKRKKLTIEADALSKDMTRAKEKKADTERQLKVFLAASVSLAKETDIEALQKQLDDQYIPLADNIKKKQGMNDDIRALQYTFNKALSDLQTLQNREIELQSNTFYTLWQQKPGTLLNTLQQSTAACIDQYEKTHPLGQDEDTRLCLANLKMLTAFLSNDATNNDIDSARSLYYQYCGLLYGCINQLNLSTHHGLRDDLLSLMVPNPIDAYEAETEFRAVLKQNSKAPQMFKNVDLLQYELDQYDTAYQTYQNALLSYSKQMVTENEITLHKWGLNLLQEINKQKNRGTMIDGTPFDMKYYTTVLNCTALLILKPGNASLYSDYQNLAGFNTGGKPSASKKIGGIMLMILGTAAIIAGVLTIPFGVTVIASGILIGIGAAMTAGGVGLFCHGKQKSVAKSLGQFDHAVEDYRKHTLVLSH